MDWADRQAVIGLLLELNRYEHAMSPTRATTREEAAEHFSDLDQQVRTQGGLFLLAEQAGRPVGFMACLLQMAPAYVRADLRHHGHVSELVVAASARGQGIGAALLAEAEAYVRGQGLTCITIGHLANNDGAARLYQRLGYEPYATDRLKLL